jgi:putative membrane protein
LPVSAGRRLSRVLSGLPVRVLTEPAVGAVLSVGGHWILYTTDLYPSMHHQPLLHLLVHLHLFTAGYLFTVAIISVDPLPHRRSFLHRSIVVIMAMAAHDVLAKHLYAHPPAGVAPAAAESGSMIMYYGGDAVDLLLVVLLWLRWYRSRAPRVAPAGPVERRSVAAHVGHESRGGDAR